MLKFTVIVASVVLIVITWRIVTKSATLRLEKLSDSDLPTSSRLWLNMLRLFLVLQVIRNSWAIPRDFNGSFGDGGYGASEMPFVDLILRFLCVILTAGVTAYLTAIHRTLDKRLRTSGT